MLFISIRNFYLFIFLVSNFTNYFNHYSRIATINIGLTSLVKKKLNMKITENINIAFALI